MHLLTIVAFAFLFWRAEQPGRWVLVPVDDVLWTIVIVLGQFASVSILAFLAQRRASRLFQSDPESSNAAQQFHHRASSLLRLLLGIGFGITVFLTRWPEWFDVTEQMPILQIVCDFFVLIPFLAGLFVMWLAAYPLERRMRFGDVGSLDEDEPASWPFRAYIDFHLRHYVLVVAVPMSFILLAANLTRGHAAKLQAWSGVSWMPDLLLGLVACVVFLVAPDMLRRIWRTESLNKGPVRDRLDRLAGRIGLRFRDILLWKSDGLMINAAVMGLVPWMRYVLLSDALLSSMSERQVEAVFGHEAGHVQHRHIQHFLVFAYVGWLAVVAVIEIIAAGALAMDVDVRTAVPIVEGIGFLATLVVWGVGFGWLSRRFERQADLFAARCVTPPAEQCDCPCSVHPDDSEALPGEGRVCATGAALFVSALDRVATLNGIPHEEYSWRHSSIGIRIRALTSLADDPNRVAQFERVIRRAKRFMMTFAVLGTAMAVGYWYFVSEPAFWQLHATTP
ncbi:MAG: M48 family metalloprotease [Planctomycetes bacterium]|nr:M48 family metalloprotease [Planctomycetota bacterium]